MATGFVIHEDYQLHDNGAYHPERPNRIEAIKLALQQTGLDEKLQPVAPRKATEAEIEAVHDPRYVSHVRGLALQGGGHLEVDTPVRPESYDVALLSAGGSIAAVDAVLAGEVDNVFVAQRPPGHHACPDRGMGFCLFNNIAVAARHALAQGVERVFIFDWDVHHGNGTQEAFYGDGQVFFCSMHQSPWFPFTGMATEHGRGAGEGTTLNFPLRAGQKTSDYLELFDAEVAPKIREFQPELLLVSSGQDIHERDPLGEMRLTSQGIGDLARRVVDVAAEVCGGRLVMGLEGGYDLLGLAEGVCYILWALRGDEAG